MRTTLYGLKNCDTCRNAVQWLREQNIDVTLHDLRADGLDEELLDKWLSDLGWESLLNRRSTTWRQLEDNEREELNADKARKLLIAHPTLIKRPLIQLNGRWIVGYSEARYATLLAGA
jgi:Spx/MgsR family transcriptional regulator